MQQEDVRERLEAILDLIGPGISLVVDETVLDSAFGHQDIVAKAKKFANDNQCAFRYEKENADHDGIGYFGRAYYREL